MLPGREDGADECFGSGHDVGGAGSATLVLQTVLPALLIAEGPTSLILEGGTHNTWAPPFDFLEKAFLPLVNRMGPHVEVELELVLPPHAARPVGTPTAAAPTTDTLLMKSRRVWPSGSVGAPPWCICSPSW